MGRSVFRPVLYLERPWTAWSCLYGSSKALALSTLLRSDTVSGPVLILVADGHAADTLSNALHFYLQDAVPILSLPDWETLPYDTLSPYQDITSRRLQILASLPTLTAGVVVVPVATALAHLLPRQHLLSYTLHLRLSESLTIEDFRCRMMKNGYRIVRQVLEHGDMAVRGSLIDLFPMGADTPFRIDLLDDEVAGIRRFDPETQRTLSRCQNVEILPASEIDMTESGITRFRDNWRARFPGNPQQCSVYREVTQGQAPAGIEYYLPLFYEATSTLFDYLPEETLIVWDQNARPAVTRFIEELSSRYAARRDTPERPVLRPAELCLSEADLYTKIGTFHQLRIDELQTNQDVEYASFMPPVLPIRSHAPEPLLALQEFLTTCTARVLIVAESTGRQETLMELFSGRIATPVRVSGWNEFVQGDEPLAICSGALEQGLKISAPDLVVICEAQLFDQQLIKRRHHRRHHDADAVIRNLTELCLGSPVVHSDHGVGRYHGLQKLDIHDMEAEFILLEYADGARLYVPVTDLNLIGRYTGADAEHAPLHRLGSGQWQKIKRRVAEQVRDVAAELLDVYARREARSGHCFQLDEDAYQSFIQDFPFVETPDQHDAILAVLHDMQQPKPMDRLICGDAGFGKTEVALRAAFVSVTNHHQVAILVPTTLLVQQHYQHFKERFASWPVRVEMLSRFQTPEEQRQVLTAVRDAKADIVIGTHRLLQKDVRFANLGLLIIDEEHRFGVRQKERFKTLRAEVDVLCLAATPIPRTLNMVLSGIREFSLINTPPSRRLAVKTFVREWDDVLIREAMLREIKRGGQVFFLHNEIKTIDKTAARIAGLLPEARVQIAHGQMSERVLESVMLDFHQYRFNVLVCTTIIETGLDIPTANTIIINRADRFGLSQLYQLRGRVGRSHHRAYAWLLLPDGGYITEDARKRLQVIESLEELGIGFTLANHDLEIRGAGELLGDEQSGHMQEVGFGMYMEMLENTVAALRAGRVPQLDRPLDHGVEIDLNVPALIPEQFLPDVQLRLILYKRIASARNQEQLQELQEEVIDRFGLPPQPLLTLFRIAALKLRLSGLGVQKIDMDEAGGCVVFLAQSNIEPSRIIRLLADAPQHYRLDGQHSLRIMQDCPDGESRLGALGALLDAIA